MVGISRPIVKHSFQVHASEIPELLRKHFILPLLVVQAQWLLIFPKDATNPAENLPTNILKK